MDNKPEPKEYFKNLKVKASEKVAQHATLPVNRITELIQEGSLQISENPIDLLPKSSKPTQPPTPKAISPEQHASFIKGVSKQRKLIQKRRQKRIRSQQQKLNQLLQSQCQQQQLLKQQHQANRKHELQERLKQLKQKIKQKQQSYVQCNRELGKVINSKTLHQRIEEKYQLLEASTLQEKKQRLAEIRKLHQPVTKQEIAEHQKFIQSLREKIQGEKGSGRELVEKPKIYKSIWYKQVSEVVVEPETVSIRDRIKEYEDHVKNNFVPEVSQSLLKESQVKKEKQAIGKKPLDSKERTQKGLEYLKFVKQHHPSVPKRTKTQQTTKKPPDYLRAFQHKRLESTGSESHNRTQLSVLKQLTNLGPQKLKHDKVDRLLEEVWKVQNKAKAKLARGGRPCSAEKIDELISASIKAKLTLLQ